MNRSLLIYILLIISIVIVYGRASRYPVVIFDDPGYISNAKPEEGGSVPSFDIIKRAFTEEYMANWVPLTWVSYMFDYFLFGLKPSTYHVTNIMMHIINTLLLFTILRVMTNAIWQSAFVAALFALHPLHVESVAWITERKDVLSTMFGFLSILIYIEYVKNGKVKIYLLAILFFILSLLSKAMFVTMPLILLLLDYWPLNRVCPIGLHKLDRCKKNNQKLNNAKYCQRPILYLLLEKIPFFFFSILFSIFTYISQRSGGAVDVTSYVPMGGRIANAIYAYVWYIKKLIFPTNLSIFYLHPYLSNSKIPLSWLQIGGSALILVVISLIVIKLRSQKYLTVGWLLYIGTLIPVIGLVRVGMQGMADRFTYIPYLGLFIIISWGVSHLILKLPPSHFCRKVLPYVSFIVILAFMYRSWIQVGYWHDSVSLFQHAAKVEPDNFFVHNVLGNAYILEREYDNAYEHLTISRNLEPRFHKTHTALGILLAQKDKNEEAIISFKTALKLKPNDEMALYNLGVSIAKEGDSEEAVRCFQKVLDNNPDSINSKKSLSLILSTHPDPNIRNVDEAIRLAEEINQQTGYNKAENLDVLARTYAAKGRFDDAIQIAEKALKLAEKENRRLAGQIHRMLNLYREGKPFYDNTLMPKDT